jgi:hypothetical protein
LLPEVNAQVFRAERSVGLRTSRLPGSGLGECAVRIGQRRVELSGVQRARANLLDEIDMRQNGAAWILLRVRPTKMQKPPFGGFAPGYRSNRGIYNLSHRN